MTMIIHLRVVRVATAILRQKRNVASKFCYCTTKAKCGIKIPTFEERIGTRSTAAKQARFEAKNEVRYSQTREPNSRDGLKMPIKKPKAKNSSARRTDSEPIRHTNKDALTGIMLDIGISCFSDR